MRHPARGTARAAGEGPREAGIDGMRESPAGDRFVALAQIGRVQGGRLADAKRSGDRPRRHASSASDRAGAAA
jgi:hypothetical protein